MKMSAMAQARIRHMESAAEVCTVALQDLPNHPELCLAIVHSASRHAALIAAVEKKPWHKRLWRTITRFPLAD